MRLRTNVFISQFFGTEKYARMPQSRPADPDGFSVGNMDIRKEFMKSGSLPAEYAIFCRRRRRSDYSSKMRL